jgi:hypothetical protein
MKGGEFERKKSRKNFGFFLGKWEREVGFLI